MQLGDMANATRQFVACTEIEEGSDLALLKKQATAAYSTATTLLEKAREKMMEAPTDPEGLILSAQRELLLGNTIRAFYWLDLTLRRAPEEERAWQLLGVVFARHNQVEQFIAQWGASKPQGDQAWLKLAQQAAQLQEWESALAFANRFVTAETPSAEEVLAAFALDRRNPKIAQEWLEKATIKRPESPSPWLVLADLAIALQQPASAQTYLQEAAARNASAEEIEKRKVRLEGGAAERPEVTPFEPVRSYIQ